MADEHNYHKGHRAPHKKENIRVFIQRKRLVPGILHRYLPSRSTGMTRLTSILGKHLNTNKKNSRNNKNIIVVNYKPVFVDSVRQKSTEQKPIPKSENLPSANNHTSNRQSVSLDVPDVDDPFMFIEMMYQQLFTEDGQLRSETEPTVLADCVKQIVTHSRRNSMAHRDSISSNLHQRMFSSPSLSSSPRFRPNTFSEEEEPNTILQRNRMTNASRRNSKRSSVDNADHHQQQLHTFLNSYYAHQKRTSTQQNTNYPFSVDDTDNEDLDTFSDVNSYRKTIRPSPPASIDEDVTEAESKLLLSSGYQSLKSHEPIISKIQPEKDHHHHCPNCMHIPQITVTPPTSSSSLNLIQPVRDVFMKCLNFIHISKNILLIPLFIFLLRQKPMHIGS